MAIEQYTNGVDQTAKQVVKPQPAAPRYTSYEDIYRAIAPQNNDYEATAAQERYEDRHRALYAVTDAVAALGNLAGTAAYGSPQQLPSLSAANNQRLDRLRQLRQAARDKYNAGLLDAAYRDRQDALQRSRYTEQTAREDKRYAEQQAREDKRYADQQARLDRDEARRDRQDAANEAYRRESIRLQQDRLDEDKAKRRDRYATANGFGAVVDGKNVYFSRAEMKSTYSSILKDMLREAQALADEESAGITSPGVQTRPMKDLYNRINTLASRDYSPGDIDDKMLTQLSQLLTQNPELKKTAANWIPRLITAYETGWEDYNETGVVPQVRDDSPTAVTNTQSRDGQSFDITPGMSWMFKQ